MKVKSMRIPEDIDQAINYISKIEKIENAQSLRKLARLGFEFYVANHYRESKITLRDAASLLKMSLSETIDLFQNMGISGNIGANEVLSSLDSIGLIEM
ncbi:MAG: hypothetical protein GY866_08215 [Proteobacteria bacterium]|nr:hypothetical protein [Pseudomonadota bacterium]